MAAACSVDSPLVARRSSLEATRSFSRCGWEREKKGACDVAPKNAAVPLRVAGSSSPTGYSSSARWRRGVRWSSPDSACNGEAMVAPHQARPAPTRKMAALRRFLLLHGPDATYRVSRNSGVSRKQELSVCQPLRFLLGA